MHSTEAINLAEQVLRDLITEVIGNSWDDHEKIDRQDLEQKRDADRAGRPGLIGDPPLIQYLEFWHLSAIINTHWDRFKQVLENKKRFSLDMARLESFRNTSMHSRDLLPHEAHLVLGIVGQIRVQIAQYRSEQGPDMNYYPKITLIQDGTYGTTLVDGQTVDVPLRPGDTFTFRCSGTDPQNRTLHWTLRTPHPMVGAATPMRETAAQQGADVELTWIVTVNHVMESTTVWIDMSSDGPYHRHGSYDDRHTFNFSVLPPIDH